MRGVKRVIVNDISDVQQILNNIWLLLEQLPIYIGFGSPENVVVADRGSIYLNKEGGSSTTLYIKESTDSKSSGWVAK